MTAFNHRNPGIVGAAVDSDVFVELIADGVHIHPSVVRSAFRLFGDNRICLISDAMRACGMSDGEYELGGKNVTVRAGAATIDNGSLAGSTTPLIDCLRNAVGFGVPVETVIKAATINPAKSVGLDDEIGSLEEGKRADMLIIDKNLSLKNVILGGKIQETLG
jgi:N-acetylglucosamine-6-phosphate deacetylase